MAMRIIAGSAGGIPLRCPRHGHIRPTMDQVRAAIFSSLANAVADARVLDIFAGTGSLGIEALSRGAASATFVEKDRRTLEYLRENLTNAHLEDRAELICTDAFSYCTHWERQASRPRFHLIFADPPYTTKDQPEDYAARLLTGAGLENLLEPEGIFVLEKSPQASVAASLAGWENLRQKRYGTAEVLFLRPLGKPTLAGESQSRRSD